MQITKCTKIIISAAVTVVLATGIICGIVFGMPKSQQLTTLEWLTLFKTGLEVALSAKDEENNVVPINIVREIEISDNVIVVAKFKQNLQITVEDGQIKALLAIEEQYPTLETTQDNIQDEYYLIGNEMYIRRQCGEDVQSSQFDSDLDILLTVASENLGNAKYNFDEDNFLPVENGKGIITHDGNVHKINAIINQDYCRKFFGESASVDGMSNVRIQMQMTDRCFDWLQIQYKQGGLDSKIKIARYDIQPITKPEWVR